MQDKRTRRCPARKRLSAHRFSRHRGGPRRCRLRRRADGRFRLVTDPVRWLASQASRVRRCQRVMTNASSRRSVARRLAVACPSHHSFAKCYGPPPRPCTGSADRTHRPGIDRNGGPASPEFAIWAPAFIKFPQFRRCAPVCATVAAEIPRARYCAV
jgi:hypothetical protein